MLPPTFESHNRWIWYEVTVFDDIRHINHHKELFPWPSHGVAYANRCPPNDDLIYLTYFPFAQIVPRVKLLKGPFRRTASNAQVEEIIRLRMHAKIRSQTKWGQPVFDTYFVLKTDWNGTCQRFSRRRLIICFGRRTYENIFIIVRFK